MAVTGVVASMKGTIEAAKAWKIGTAGRYLTPKSRLIKGLAIIIQTITPITIKSVAKVDLITYPFSFSLSSNAASLVAKTTEKEEIRTVTKRANLWAME